MSISKEASSGGPSILDHFLAGVDELRQSFRGSGPTESTTTVRTTGENWIKDSTIRLKIYPRGGERVRLELPNGGWASVDVKR